MHKFDYLFLKNKPISAKFIGLTNVIYNLKNRSNEVKNNYKEEFAKLEKIARYESIVESNELEGVFTTKERLDQIIELNKEPLNHNEEEISGYRDAIDYLTKNYENESLSLDLIKKIHSFLMAKHEKGNCGEYKKEDNYIVSVDESLNYKVLFNPVKAKDVEIAMNNLFLAYIIARDDSEVNDLLLIACFIVDFLSIHPFKDGNGRISRLLTLFLLYKNGYDIGKYISLEKMINKYKGNYYDSLKKSQEKWHSNENDYEPYMLFFVQILCKCYEEGNDRLFTINKKENKTNKIKKNVLDSITPISKKEIIEKLNNVSISTVEKILSEMLKSGEIIKIGNYKDARYIKK